MKNGEGNCLFGLRAALFGEFWWKKNGSLKCKTLFFKYLSKNVTENSPQAAFHIIIWYHGQLCNMTKATISIAEVLADSQVTTAPGGNPRYFSLRFAKDDGSVSTIARASRNVKRGKATKGAKTNLQAANLMLLYDHDAGTHKYVTISLITHFNGVRVFH